ncbi:MAG: hypothetical protein GX663_09265 [Clostridiales bacterium]|nr:hypothetical protein [Clostridiales bacterium]
MGNQVKDLSSQVKGIDGKADSFGSELHFLKLMLENDIVPRLGNIENCYTSTYERYVIGLEEMQSLQADVDILKRVVHEHGKKLQTM